MKFSYYNEIDPYAAQWLRNLIAAGHIAQGEVDERSICEVDFADIKGFAQCHFFAGIGVWSHALRLAGWPDDRPVWTGSCPCQPFSSAGKGAGFADERHLWPAFHHLISECRPPVVFGEQVASKDGLAWLDLVQADLEGSGYASAAADLCAAGIGAPHIRQRLYWVADAQHDDGRADKQGRGSDWRTVDGGGGTVVRLDNNNNTGLERHRADQTQSGWIGEAGSVATAGKSGGVGDSEINGDRKIAAVCQGQNTQSSGSRDWPAPTNGHWRDADWLYCRDGKWRPVEPGTFPLAYGATARVGRLRAYGNAIVPQVAQTFIEAYLETA